MLPSKGDPGFAESDAENRYGGFLPTLSSGVIVQGLGSLASVLVIHLLTGELGGEKFGILIVIMSLAPWLALFYSAVSPVVRILVGESRGREKSIEAPPTLLRNGVRLTSGIVAITLLVWVGLVFVLPLESLFGATGVVDNSELIASVLIFSVPVILGGFGSPFQGALDGVGRNAAAITFGSLGPIIAFPLTLIAVYEESNLVILSGIQGFSWAVGRLGPLVWWRLRPSLAERDPASSSGRIRLRLVMQMAWITAAATAQTGFDPLIVSSQLGAAEAASFGIANQLVVGALIPLTILTPLFMANMAAARGSGWSKRHSRDLKRLLLQSSAAGVIAGVILFELGPWVAEFLGSGEVEAPRSLYLAAGAVVLASFMAAPLQWVLSGPAGLRVAVRIQTVMVIGNILLSLWLANLIGTAGPFVGTASVYLIGATTMILAIRLKPQLLAEQHS